MKTFNGLSSDSLDWEFDEAANQLPAKAFNMSFPAPNRDPQLQGVVDEFAAQTVAGDENALAVQETTQEAALEVCFGDAPLESTDTAPWVPPNEFFENCNYLNPASYPTTQVETFRRILDMTSAMATEILKHRPGGQRNVTPASARKWAKRFTDGTYDPFKGAITIGFVLETGLVHLVNGRYRIRGLELVTGAVPIDVQFKWYATHAEFREDFLLYDKKKDHKPRSATEEVTALELFEDVRAIDGVLYNRLPQTARQCAFGVDNMAADKKYDTIDLRPTMKAFHSLYGAEIAEVFTIITAYASPGNDFFTKLTFPNCLALYCELLRAYPVEGKEFLVNLFARRDETVPYVKQGLKIVEEFEIRKGGLITRYLRDTEAAKELELESPRKWTQKRSIEELYLLKLLERLWNNRDKTPFPIVHITNQQMDSPLDLAGTRLNGSGEPLISVPKP